MNQNNYISKVGERLNGKQKRREKTRQPWQAEKYKTYDKKPKNEYENIMRTGHERMWEEITDKE